MKYCEDCDIVHDLKNCPLCDAKDEIDELAEQVNLLTDEISEIKTKD